MAKKKYKYHQHKTTKTVIKPKEDKSKYIYIFLVLLLTAIVYSNSIDMGFADWDDNEQIVKNADIKSLNFNSIKKIFTSYYVGMYQPLTSLSFAIEYNFFGLDAKYYHLDNLILHLLNVLLVFFLVFEVTSNRNISWIMALLFGIHPMHVESVTWITERKDVLYGFFFLAGLLFYVKYIKTKNIKFLSGTFLLFLLSLLSKSAAVAFPAVIVLLDYFFKSKYDIKKIISTSIFFLIGIGFGILTFFSQQESGALADLDLYSIFERICLVTYAASFYIIKFFIPFNLSAMHYFPVKESGFLPFQYYLSLPFIILITVLALINKSSYKKDFIFGLGFFLVTIVMVLQIVPIGFAHTAERYTYIPYIGLAFPVIKFLYNESEKKALRPALIAILVVMVGYFSYTTYKRNPIWDGGVSLFTDVIKKNPKHFHGYWIRGSAYSGKKMYQEALADFNMTYKLKHPKPAEVLNNIGNVKINLNDYQGALNDLNEALRLQPDLAEAYSNKGNALDNLGKMQEAMRNYDKAIALKPDMITAYNNRGVAQGKMGLLDEAIKDFNIAISINPYDPSAYINRGNAKGFKKDFKGSIEDFNNALRLNGEGKEIYFNRGLSKLQLYDIQGACSDWQEALKLGNNSASELLNKHCI